MSIWSDIWELFFPRYCVLCGERLPKGEEFLCFKCLSGLPRMQLGYQKDNVMEKNLWGKFPVERASAYMHYTKGGDSSKLLYELKYRGNYRLGIYLGRCMAAEMIPSGFFEGIDCIMPVPLHEKRHKERGYNQSEMLAEGMSRLTGIPLSGGLMVRARQTETQTRKGSYERWMNVKNVFECTFPEQLEGKHILLVDDVMTTGATIVACADALSGIPRLRISVLTLALAGGL